MTPYHVTPITPEDVAARALAGRHALVSYATPEQLGLVQTVCQSFIGDNSAYTLWTQGKKATDWSGFYAWAAELSRHPACDFCFIPDVIEGGTEADNDALVEEWPHGTFGVPIWHMGESLERLERLAADWPRIALGSSGEYADPNSAPWWNRMAQAMEVICDSEGRPRVRCHGLRMLHPAIVSRVPLASADSSSVARNIGLDTRWVGEVYQPKTKGGRAAVLIDRIEHTVAATRWAGRPVQEGLFGRVA